MEKGKDCDNMYNIDLTKFILCICVVGIHTMGKFGLYPFLRIAVPMFFCISSYLFFRKLDGSDDISKLKKLIFRNAKLYLFWLGILIIPTLYLRGWLEGNLLINTIKFCFKIILGSTFSASWYIPALVFSTVIVYFGSKLLSDKICLFGAFFIYAFCCIASTYRGILPVNSLVYRLIILYPGTIYNSFPVGILWVLIGKILAEREVKIKKRILYASAIVFLIILSIEYYVAVSHHWVVDNDCCFALVPVCTILMLILTSSSMKIEPLLAVRMRKASTIIYCVHGTIALALKAAVFNGVLTLVECIGLFIVTFGISLIVAVIIIGLAEKDCCKLLRFAY